MDHTRSAIPPRRRRTLGYPAPVNVRALLLALLVSWLLPEPLQNPPLNDRDRIAVAMKKLRDRRSTEQEQDAAMVELLFLGAEGPKSLANWLERDLKVRHKEGAREEQQLFGSFEKRANALLKARLDQKAWSEIGDKRSIVLRNARNQQLTKAQIEGESDPAVERLEALLTIGAKEVWDADPELFERWDVLLAARDRDYVLIETWDAAKAALSVHPEGGPRAGKKLQEPEFPPTSEELLDRADFLAELATPMSGGDRKILEANAAIETATGQLTQEGELGPEEQRGIRALNLRRVLLGLNAQRIDLKLCHACRDHSNDMSEHDFFAHESPVEGKKTPWDRASLAGTSASSENIARGAQTGPDAIRQWWYSPGHHRNMLSGGGRTGLGRHGNFWTQLFGG